MKRLETQFRKTFDSELKKLLDVLPLLKLNDKRRINVLQQIQQIKKIQKIDSPTQVNITTSTQSPLQNFLKKKNNEKISKKEPNRSRYNTV